MAVKAWKLFTPEQAAELASLSPQLATHLIEVTKADLDIEVEATRRPMLGKFVIDCDMLETALTRPGYDPVARELREIPDPEGAHLYVAAATGEDHILVADSEALF